MASKPKKHKSSKITSIPPKKKRKLSESNVRHINTIISNPGYDNITQIIFGCLDHQDQLNVRLVDHSWKAHIDQPHFWIKKLDLKGQTQELRDAWIDLAQHVEKGSTIEKHLTKCLMTWHKLIHAWDQNYIAVMDIATARYSCLLWKPQTCEARFFLHC